MRANEARYFSTHYGLDFVVYPAAEKPEICDYIDKVLLQERQIVMTSPRLEVAEVKLTMAEVGPVRWTIVGGSSSSRCPIGLPGKKYSFRSTWCKNVTS